VFDQIPVLGWIAISMAAFAGVGRSIAAIIRETYQGRAILVRAKRGDPEPPQAIELVPDRGRRNPRLK
jgi:hypothetical protein